MPHYRFAIHGDRAPKPITAFLPDDDTAWDYGESIVRHLLRESPSKCKVWTIEITDGNREVASIGFDLKALKERRSIQ